MSVSSKKCKNQKNCLSFTQPRCGGAGTKKIWVRLSTGEVINTTDEVRNAFLIAVRPVAQWVVCLDRMGNMFFCFGLLPLGYGLFRSKLIAQWLGAATILIGIAGIVVLMIYETEKSTFLPIAIAITLWYIVLGVIVMLGVNETNVE